MKCNICNEGHPTALHKDVEKDKGGEKDKHEGKKKTDKDDRVEAYSRSTHADEVDGSSTQISMPILPANIYHSSYHGRYLVVFAMLDACSGGVFLLQSSADELGVSIRRVPVTVKTASGIQKGELNRAEGLTYSGKHNYRWVSSTPTEHLLQG